MSERVLCVLAHLDAGPIGFRETLANHVRSGDELSIVVMADGVGERTRGGTGAFMELVRERHGMFRKACKEIGTDNVWIHQYREGQMENQAGEIAAHIKVHFARFKPTKVYTHNDDDENADRRVVARACRGMTA